MKGFLRLYVSVGSLIPGNVQPCISQKNAIHKIESDSTSWDAIKRSFIFKWIKGERFWRNCDTASVREYNRVIWYYQLSWWRKLAFVKSFKADVSSVSPSSERNVSFETLYGVKITLPTQLIMPTYLIYLQNHRGEQIDYLLNVKAKASNLWQNSILVRLVTLSVQGSDLPFFKEVHAWNSAWAEHNLK